MKFLLNLSLALSLGISSQAQQLYTSTSGNLQVFVSFAASHDSTQCASQLQVLYDITKQNSFMGEVIEIKDMFGNLVNSLTNSTGANPFQAQVPAFFGFCPDYQVSGGNAFFAASDGKVIASTDTIYNISNTYFLPVSDPCEYDYVNGKVYIDYDADCVFNNADLPLNSVSVGVGGTFTNSAMSSGGFTNPLGDYSVLMQKSWMLNITAQLPSQYQFIFPISSCQAPILTTSTLPVSGFDFALECSSNVDLQTGGCVSGQVRPAVPFILNPYVSNTGCDAVTGILKVVLDNRVTYNPILSSNPANNILGDTLYWNYSYLTNLNGGSGYWNSFFAGIHLTPDTLVNIGDTLCFEFIADAPANDIFTANNYQRLCLPVVNSYDPNAKSVLPAGEGSEGFIPANTPLLTYTVQFQNTGNANAINIYIIDTLDADVDPASFRILGASHSMRPKWLASNVVQFDFPSIYLPDSNSNEPESHGFVSYQIEPLANLAIGTEITNTAHIYFDFNPAIVTNTTLNTIEMPAATTFVAQNALWTAYPNPAKDYIYVQADASLLGQPYFIMDLLGRTVQFGNITNELSSIDVQGLPEGIYLMRLGEQEGAVLKLMIGR